jgi:hypothetical protein
MVIVISLLLQIFTTVFANEFCSCIQQNLSERDLEFIGIHELFNSEKYPCINFVQRQLKINIGMQHS